MSQALPDILQKIVQRRRERLAAEPPREVGAQPRAEPLESRENAFLAALQSRRGRAVIAEVKMGSPRLGSLAGQVEPLAQAAAYAENGAAALSVVVEPDFFFGSYELLRRLKAASGLPAIAKDFVVDPRQLLWAREAGADAVLLVACLHDAATLRHLAGLARALGVAPLIELDSAADVAKLSGASWELVGVNNRDLRTFEVSLERSLGLAAGLPRGALWVAESGLSRSEDLRRLAAAGFDAFLIGEALLKAADPGARLQELLGS